MKDRPAPVAIPHLVSTEPPRPGLRSPGPVW